MYTHSYTHQFVHSRRLPAYGFGGVSALGDAELLDRLKLNSLRRGDGADLLRFDSLVESAGWRSLLPGSLSVPDLIGLAVDLRSAEEPINRQRASESTLAAPMFVVLHLLLRDRAESNLSANLSGQTIDRCLSALQWAVEREIVSRLVGRGGTDTQARLLDAVNQAKALSPGCV
jgi:hypothetical protein